MPGVSGLLCDDIPDVDSGPTPGPAINCKVNQLQIVYQKINNKYVYLHCLHINPEALCHH